MSKILGAIIWVILSIGLLFWALVWLVVFWFWAFSSDEPSQEVSETSTGTLKPAEEPKPKQEENSAYTTCMAQTEYLKGADKERLIKACEKNKGQDASLEKNQEYAKKKKGDIVIWCRKVIKEQLKQPSSADFRELSYYTNYQEIIYKTEVTSKNDFNAEVRNIVMCTLDIKDGKPGTINAKLEQ